MNWVTILWPVMTGACLTMALIHAVLWYRERRIAHFLFALLAVSIAAISIGELAMMFAPTPGHYGDILRWLHVPGAVMFISLALFVRVQYPASRSWLCWSVVATRLGALLANFLTGVNINFAEISELRLLDMGWGAIGAVPVGTVNPWMALGQASNLLLLAFLVDTILRARRSDDPEQARNAFRFCASAIVFTMLSNAWHAGVVIGLISAPDVLVPTFLCMLGIMSYELSSQVVRAGKLATVLSETQGRMREQEVRMDIAVRAAELGLWSWDIGSDRMLLSEEGRRLLGIGQEASVDRAMFLERVHPADRPLLGRAFSEASGRAGAFSCEFRVPGPDGTDRWVSSRGSIQYDGQGQAHELIGILVDVTARKQNDERFQLAVDAAPNLVLLVGPLGTIVLANRKSQEVLGYGATELAGMDIEDLVPGIAEGRLGAHGVAVSEGARPPLPPPGVDLLARRRDGSELPVEVALSPLRIGNEAHLLASITDISERRRLEHEAAVHRNELAHLSRVAMLAELSGSLAHELNQPLTAILSNAQAALRFLAKEPPDLGEVRDSLLSVVDSDRRAGEVIRRLRAMLRREPPDYQPVDANELVLDVLRIVHGDLVERSTKTSLSLASDLPAMRGDRVQLQQVLLNLVMNGCDAMAALEASDRILQLRTRRVGETDLEIAVIDAGPGIPPADLERIFSPFFTTKRDGMGLGLAVCRTIMTSHGGQLSAANEDGGGARVWIRLPGIIEAPGSPGG